jgi:hypothetical protein
MRHSFLIQLALTGATSLCCSLFSQNSIAQITNASLGDVSSLAGISRSNLLEVRLIGATTDLAFGQNANQSSLRAGTQSGIRGNRATVSIAATPIEPVAPDQAITLTAVVRGDNLDGAISFRVNGNAIAACTNIVLIRTANLADTSVARCSTTTSNGNEDTFVAAYRYASAHPRAGLLEESPIRVHLRSNLPARYQDMWWAGTAENGWGLSVAQHGGTQFNAFYVYDAAGKATWYVMPGGTWNADRSSYSGALYQPTGAPYFQYNSGALNVGASLGSATITFNGANNATLNYNIGGAQGSKSMQRQPFGAPETSPRMAVGDLWWGGTEQNGWGINIAQQGDTLFVVWFTYDAAGRPAFIVMPGGRWVGTRYEGSMYVTESSPWVGVAYDPRRLSVTTLGTMSIEFSDSSTATMTYVVDGVSRTNIITRQPFE